MPDDNEFVDCLINGMFPLRLPRWRARFYEEKGEHPGWEKNRLEDMHQIVQFGWRIMDIGAEHGDFTALYRKWVGAPGDVTVIEPSLHYWPIIRAIWAANGVERPPEGCFVGFASDKADAMFLPGTLTSYRWPEASEGEGTPEGGFRHLAQQRDTTPQITIDEILGDTVGDMAPIQGVVMDIEGAEWDALQGASHTLKQYRPVWWISIHNSESMEPDGTIWRGPLKEWYGKDPGDIHDLMAQHKYKATYLGNDGGEEHWRYHPEEMTL